MDPQVEPVRETIEETDIAKEMKDSFLDYSMSVIVSRALPDVRDGMKPVHRRILYSMASLNMGYTTAHKKSARIVGDVIGKYHPHGDTAVYEAMVRMAQDFSYRYPLVDGHGNFGSLDGDGAAAMRYTEARMARIASEMVSDINKETVDMIETYDGEGQEPSILPSRIPNLLLNGSTGIAVGMMTNIPTHNFSEVVSGIKAVIENPQISTVELMEHIPGPDFPTGGIIMGKSEIKKAYESGSGSIRIRSRYKIETFDHGRKRIVFYEIPYMVNKLKLFEQIINNVKSGNIEGVSRLNDESNRNGIRIVIELKKNVQENVILNQLFRLTPLQSNYKVNMLALVNGRPRQLSLREIIQAYIDHQCEIIERRSRFDLKKAKERLHIVEGLRIALSVLDELIPMIRNSRDPEDILIAQMNEAFGLDDLQSKAILAMQIRRLSALEQGKLEDEYNELNATIADLNDILSNHQRVLQIIVDDLEVMEKKYGDARRTKISEDFSDVQDADLIPRQDIVVTLTESGYIKAQPLEGFHTQNKGGKGIKSTSLFEEDSIDRMLAMNSHDYILLFSNLGKVYRLVGYRFGLSSKQAKGTPIINYLPLKENEKIEALLPYQRSGDVNDLIFVTRKGMIKRTPVKEFHSINSNGKIAISLQENDSLAFIKGSSGSDEIFVTANNGRSVHFREDKVRETGRMAAGVKAIALEPEEEVVGVTLKSEGTKAMLITKEGMGKRIDLSEVRVKNRGTRGTKTINFMEPEDELVGFRAISGNNDALVSTKNGKIIRIDLEDVRELSRYARGSKIIRLDAGDEVKRLALTPLNKEEEEKELEAQADGRAVEEIEELDEFASDASFEEETEESEEEQEQDVQESEE